MTKPITSNRDKFYGKAGKSTMKFHLVVVLVVAFCLEETFGILRIGEPIPTDWGSNVRYYEYVKDRDDCRFGYRISPKTKQVINVFNCTNEDPGVFFVLELRICAASHHVYNRETCEYTPDVDEDDNDYADDINCRSEFNGVAPDPTNCMKYLQCDKDKSSRYGKKMCARGQFFSNETYRCEHMWQSNTNGTIQPLSDYSMCQERPIPAGRRRNYGAIMTKCVWNWDFNNANTYSVSEPLDCRIYYLCSRFNPVSIDTSVTYRCSDIDTYWSDSLQECVQRRLMKSSELQTCNLRAQ